ncbi:MAG: transposase [Acidimicrobiales bacterium]
MSGRVSQARNAGGVVGLGSASLGVPSRCAPRSVGPSSDQRAETPGTTRPQHFSGVSADPREARGRQLKEELADIFQMPLLKARRALDDWLHFASRSRLAPFVKLARTIRHYRDSIEATIEYGFTNGIAEANNSVIGRIRRNANGFHNPQSFITMIMLDRGGLGPTLPWTP